MAKEIGTNDLLETWGSTGAVVEPSAGKIAGGWEFEEQPPHEYMNWVHNHLGQSINYMMRSGVPAWNSETAYAVGSYVAFSGRIWGALVANANSEPSVGNTNWQAVPTTQELAAVAFSGDVGDLAGVTVDAAELNVLDGVAIVTAELNRLTGVTGNVQTQLNAKQALSNMLTAIAALGSTGLITRTGAGAVAARSIASANTDIAVANGNAVAGNPTLTARRLSQAEIQNAASTIFGMTSGQRVAQAIDAQFNVSGGAPKFACRAWVNFNGTTTPPTIIASGNVSSVVRNGAGNYTVNFSTAMPDANYVVAGNGIRPASDAAGDRVSLTKSNTLSTSASARIFTREGGGNSAVDTNIDMCVIR